VPSGRGFSYHYFQIVAEASPLLDLAKAVQVKLVLLCGVGMP
jgi:hypothetical protein